MAAPAASPFLTPATSASTDALAILHLRRDSLVPTILRKSDTQGTGYAEGCVANTRFGSYPHSTLIDQPWGSQVLASQVDTGSRGRQGHKRKRGPEDQTDATPEDPSGSTTSRAVPDQKAAVRAASGFCHIIQPTPEAWTQSLPHRTQVVYTPDYSFVIQKLRIRPGSTVIEAGAGSGSFTHAAARAVFHGYPAPADAPDTPRGRVLSFEYHEPRVATLRAELRAHGLDSLVSLTHRDVYAHGFAPAPPAAGPGAQHVFLDLPAPWSALPHLSRSTHPPALDPSRPSHLCAFLPCIEQAQRMAGALRAAGWVELRVLELAQRRLEARRDRVGLGFEGLRGVNAVAGSVDEAVARLRVVEGRARGRRAGQLGGIVRGTDAEADGDGDGGDGDGDGEGAPPREARESRAARLERIAREAHEKKAWLEGRLVLRTEPEIKTHTSYLVFAVLPRAWSAQDEERARQKWGHGTAKTADADALKGRGKKGRGK